MRYCDDAAASSFTHPPTHHQELLLGQNVFSGPLPEEWGKKGAFPNLENL